MRAAVALLIVVGSGLAVLGVGGGRVGPCAQPPPVCLLLPGPKLGIPWGLQYECILLTILT